MTHAEESKSDNKIVEKQLSDDINVLEAEVAEMTLQREKVMQSIRDLREAEDPANKVFYHVEIHAAQQEKLRLDVDIKFRTNKVNRINLGIEDSQPSEGLKSGFLF